MFFKSRPKITAENVKNLLGTVQKDAPFAGILGQDWLADVRVSGNSITLVMALPSPQLKEHGQDLQTKVQELLRSAYPNANLQCVLTNDASHTTVTSGEGQVHVRSGSASTHAAPEKPKNALFSDEPVAHITRVLVVASGKGGVGKSTLTMLLAHALHARGLRVGILDADIYGPSLPRMLGVFDKPDLVDGKLQPIVRHGIRCMSLGFLIGEEAAILRGPMMSKALQQMVRGTAWGTAEEPLDILLIDTPPGTGDVAISLAQMIPVARHERSGAVVVTTPQDMALDDVKRCIDSLQKMNIPLLGIVENMSYFEDASGIKHSLFGRGGGERLAQTYHVPLLGTLALKPEIGQTLDRGEAPRTELVEPITQFLLA